MKLITLAKRLDFKTEIEYFNYCIDSYYNGNFSQCKELFADMTEIDRKRLVNYIKGDYKYSDFNYNLYNFYFNLL